MADVAGLLFNRWGDGGSCKEYNREEMAQLLAISIGLGALFGESLEAERAWMQTFHPALKCRPLVALIRGETAAVLAVVNNERGLR